MDKELFTHVPTSAKIDLTTWGFADWGKNVSPSEITSILREGFDETPPRISFPYSYNPKGDGRRGPPVDDPLTVFIEVPLGPTEDESPEWSCSLRNVLLYELSSFRAGWDSKGPILDEEGRVFAKDVADSLRALADELDAIRAIPVPPKVALSAPTAPPAEADSEVQSGQLAGKF